MTSAPPRPDATLPEWLHAHAHAVSRRRLAFDLFGGAVLAAAAALLRPPGWPAVLGAGLCFAAFGAWAVADRRLEAPWDAGAGDRRAVWRLVRGGAGLVGALAAMLLGYALLFGVLGTWIS